MLKKCGVSSWFLAAGNSQILLLEIGPILRHLHGRNFLIFNSRELVDSFYRDFMDFPTEHILIIPNKT